MACNLTNIPFTGGGGGDDDDEEVFDMVFGNASTAGEGVVNRNAALFESPLLLLLGSVIRV
jgi:hypothetical protein